jgi:prepilin-type N-terminal cleavage/methylation domain-containing protein
MKNRHHRSQPLRRRSRRGVTLVELIVAMTVLSVGLLAIVGTSATIARGLGEARSDNLAAIIAQSRFETIAGSSCTGMTLNSTTTVSTRGVTEKFVIQDGGNNTRLVIDSVSWQTRRGMRRQVFSTLLPCRPSA